MFVDPGYNDDPKSLMKNFIDSNANKVKKPENKKVIIGPGQKKGPTVNKNVESNEMNDFFSLDLLGSGNQPQPASQSMNEQANIFDDVLGGS